MNSTILVDCCRSLLQGLVINSQPFLSPGSTPGISEVVSGAPLVFPHIEKPQSMIAQLDATFGDLTMHEKEKDETTLVKSIFVPLWPTEDLASIYRRVVEEARSQKKLDRVLSRCMEKMFKQTGASWEEIEQSMQTLLSHLINVKKYPTNPMYRKIGIHNSNFKWKVLRYDRFL